MFSPYLIIIFHFIANFTTFLAHTGKNTGARLVPLSQARSNILSAQLSKGILEQEESLSFMF